MAYYSNYNNNYDNSSSPTGYSKYNDGLGQIFRLNELWNKCNTYSVEGKLLEWNWVLDTIYRELSRDIVAGSDEEKQIASFNKNIAESKKNNSLLYKYINDKEIFLRRLQNKQKKGTSYEDPFDDEIVD